jgi:hypothetical protein
LKRFLQFITLSLISLNSWSQHYWQQEIDYRIEVMLTDSNKTLDGEIQLLYKNNSPDTLNFIWFHLWPNAYKNDRTALTDQMLQNGSTELYFADEQQKGYINRLDFTVDDKPALIEDHPQHQDIIKLLLPHPLVPNSSISIKTPFRVKLPYVFSRSGYVGSSFQITQWYPKPAVYDAGGWHPMPYLDNGEFYSEFGKFDVEINVPEKYIVAATGNLVDQQINKGRKKLHYQESDVHDFAWFADSSYLVKKGKAQVENHEVDLEVYYHKKTEKNWDSALSILQQTLLTRGKWLGPYPYKTVKVVESMAHGTGGMEYPTITIISTPSDIDELEELIGHEVGHNWLYGILASNERDYPWMDEGMNTYFDNRFHHWRKTINGNSKKKGFDLLPENQLAIASHSMIAIHKDQPINTPSAAFNLINYNAIVYGKTAEWMSYIENRIGEAAFDSMMREYYQTWKFKHPQPEDFKNIAAKYLGSATDTVFSLLDKKGYIVKPVRRGLSVKPFLSLNNTEQKNNLFISPALGYNTYDGWMVGGIVHNYTLPLPKFKFILAPLYAKNSRQFNYIGKVGYTFYRSNGSNLEISVNGSKFNMDSFTDSTGKENFLRFRKIVPTLRYSLANRDPRSTIKKYIQWKTFLIRETGLNFSRDTITQKDVITYPETNRYLNQLSVVIENSRKLYPYRAAFVVEQAEQFVRLNLTANYFFNFARGGGLDLRFFAGKFFYTREKTFLVQYQTDRYHLNMTGPKGDEDYTYSNYFPGRNEFAYTTFDPGISTAKNFFRGLPVAQIMQRDGYFKIRTDLLSNKIGKTDDWLSAINISTSIPNSVNPLNLFPLKIPLKLFLDLGTYAEAWDKKNASGRFLYDAGLQLSFFKNALNIYFPVLYSKPYKDYVNSTIVQKKFLKNISFSIDLQNLAPNKLFSISPF